MRKFGLFVLMTLLFISGVSTLAQDNKKRRKGEPQQSPVGYISVKTSPEAYPVFINGRDRGMSGTTDSQRFDLEPGTYDLEVRFPGKNYRRTINVERGKNSCVCLSYASRVVSRPCPYEVSIAAESTVRDGDNIVFTASPTFQNNTPVNLNYKWTVQPQTARIREGQGTPSITVDSTGLAGQTVTATLEVDTGYDDAACRQRLPFSTAVAPLEVVRPTPRNFDVFDFVTNDALKARLDNFASALQQQPENQGYIIVYGKTGDKSAASERLGMFALDYLTRDRKIDARRVTVVSGDSRTQSAFELYLVPPGADPPTPR